MTLQALIFVTILLVIYQWKHFLADYPFQGAYMLQKFRPDWGFFLPLTAHAGVHAAMTFLIVVFVEPALAAPLALFDFVVHFIMDRIKAGPKYLGRFKNFSGKEYMTEIKPILDKLEHGSKPPQEIADRLKSNTYFWWSLGLDQKVHHLTHYVIILVVTAKHYNLY